MGAGGEGEDRDMMFGWQLYFGELPGEGGAAAGSPGDAGGGDSEHMPVGERRDTDLEYGWRLYFNELPVSTARAHTN